MELKESFIQSLARTIFNKEKVVEMNVECDSPLIEVVPHRKVQMNLKPYRHVIIDNFFKEEFYEKLSKECNDILSQGLSERPDRNKLSRFGSYDAYGLCPNPRAESAINIFRTQAWRKYFADLFSRDITNDEIMSFHYHKANSASGSKHNDYSLCSFSDDCLPNGINAWYDQCLYEDSDPFKQPDTHKVMRSITIIYYLNNQGDGLCGGGTDLFGNEGLSKTVSPVNNRLLAFECSPISWHAFEANPKFPRSTLIQWFHADPGKTFKYFGNDNYVPW